MLLSGCALWDAFSEENAEEDRTLDLDAGDGGDAQRMDDTSAADVDARPDTNDPSDTGVEPEDTAQEDVQSDAREDVQSDAREDVQSDARDVDETPDAGDTADVPDIVDEPEGSIAWVQEPADFALWVAGTSAPIKLTFQDPEGDPVAPETLDPDAVSWNSAPQDALELRNCDNHGCTVKALRAGEAILTATAPGFGSASLNIEIVGWQTVAAGDGMSCAIDTRGRLYCWGVSEHGALGLGIDTKYQLLPARVGPELLWNTVSLGGNYTADSGSATCATTRDGELYCWGANTEGRLGIGDVPENAGDSPDRGPDVVWEPTRVTDTLVQANWERVAVGNAAACGLTDDGLVYCWGGSQGELGIGIPDTRRAYPSEPALRGNNPAEQSNWAGLSVSYSMVYAWTDLSGANTYVWGNGLLGSGANERFDTPHLLIGHSFSKVASGKNHRCGLTRGGEIKCWGSNRDNRVFFDEGGALACTGPKDYGLCVPVEIEMPEELVVDVSAGETHTCAIAQAEQRHIIRCWGYNDHGQLGNGEQSPSEESTTVTYPDQSMVQGEYNWASVSAGVNQTCAITQSGELFCWGRRLAAQGTGGHWQFAKETTPRAITNPQLD